MAYQNKFVVSVIHDGKIVKEANANPSVATLPFGSEYGLRLRNRNDKRCSAKVFLDNEHVGTWVIDKDSFIDVYRPANKDAAFKFVSLDSTDAQEFGKSDNNDGKKGLVRVEFRLERNHYQALYHWNTPVTTIGYWNPNYEPYPWTLSSYNSLLNTTTASIGPAKGSSLSAANLDGCTVEGNATGQTFGSTMFYAEYSSSIVEIILKGYEPKVKQEVGFPSEIKMDSTIIPPKIEIKPIDIPAINLMIPPVESPAEKTKYCTECGVIRGPTWKFCSDCGTKF